MLTGRAAETGFEEGSLTPGRRTGLLLLFFLLVQWPAFGLESSEVPLQGLRYRLIGPYRGGRVTAVSGVPGDFRTYYFGAASGGIWKTVDAGVHWTPIFDDQGVAAIGALAVDPQQPDTLYAGTGDTAIRINTSYGNGLYRSRDAGRSWQHLGLEATRRIGRIVVHPRNSQILYVAALGRLYTSSADRGIYRSRDGGGSWQKVLYVDADTGAIDLSIDPSRPDKLFAAMWSVRRTPYNLTSGGPGSGLFVTQDGGDNWSRLEGNGLPEGILGKMGISVSPASPNRIYACIEAEQGGLYRSDDGGLSWQHLSSSHNLTQRAWYFMRVYPDPLDPDTVWVLNLNLLRSTDGGKTFERIPQPHVDNMDLWIDPGDPRRVINGNDGGANISLNAGTSWSRSDNNQPTGQFYHASLDDRFPYHIYTGQQDWSTIAITSRSNAAGITDSDWYDVGGCEMGFSVPDPADHRIVYSGCTDAGITRFDLRIGRSKSIEPWPESTIGHGAVAARYRFQWTAPLLASKHQEGTIYFAGNVLFRSRDRGEVWEVISPDLTRDDPGRQQSSGGPITQDNIGSEYYDTIFALTESPIEKGVLWVGSDDGLVHVTRDGGHTWANVTPPNLPEWTRINSIDASRHNPGTAFVSGDRHKLDDFEPYIFLTTDFGSTWQRIGEGIPEGSFVRVIRQDPKNPRLLFAGTETGVFVSLDGQSFSPLRLNLPTVPVYDLVIRESDLVVATYGRALWILDDFSPLRTIAEVPAATVQLFDATPVYRIRDNYARLTFVAGENPPPGAIVYYTLPEAARENLELTILDSAGQVVRSFSADEEGRAAARDALSGQLATADRYDNSSPLTNRPGLNRFVWDLRYPSFQQVPEALLFWHEPLTPPVGPLALPGDYGVRLTVDGTSIETALKILPDPRLPVDLPGLREQFELHSNIAGLLTTVSTTVVGVRNLRHRLDDLQDKADRAGRLETLAGGIAGARSELEVIEQGLTEPRMETSADAFNYPLRLDNRLTILLGVVANGEGAPTAAAREVFALLEDRFQALEKRVKALVNGTIASLNREAKRLNLHAIEGGRW